MKKIFLFLFLALCAVSVFAQAPLIPSVRCSLTTVTIFSDPYTVSGRTIDMSSNWDATSIAAGDSLYLMDGNQLRVYRVLSITPSGTNFAASIDDINNSGQIPVTGIPGAFYRGTTNYEYPNWTSGLSEQLNMAIQNRFVQRLDASLYQRGTDYVTTDSFTTFIGYNNTSFTFNQIPVGANVWRTTTGSTYQKTSSTSMTRRGTDDGEAARLGFTQAGNTLLFNANLYNKVRVNTGNISAVTINNPQNEIFQEVGEIFMIGVTSGTSQLTVTWGNTYGTYDGVNFTNLPSSIVPPLATIYFKFRVISPSNETVKFQYVDGGMGNGDGNITREGVPTVWNTESLAPVKVVLDSIYRGSDKKVRVLSIGDSNTNHQSFNLPLNDLFAAEFDTMALGLMIPTADVPSGFTQTVSAGQVNTDPESLCRIKWHFDATSDSLRLEYLPNSVANRNFNKASFFLQRLPNGGTLRFRIGHGTTTVYDQSVNAAFGSVSDTILSTGILSIPSGATAWVRITCTTPGTAGAFLHGYFLENTTDVGYEGIRLGVNGYSAETWNDVFQKRTFKRAIQHINPRVVSICLGTNDVGFANPNNNVTYFRSKVGEFVDSLKSYLPGVSVWLMSPGDTKNEARPTGPNAFTTEMVDTAMYGLARQKQAAFMSIRQLMGDTKAIAVNNLYSDFSHYNTAGQRLIGNTMYEALGWVRPYTIPPTGTPSILRAAPNNNQARIQSNTAADRWLFDFSSGGGFVTVSDGHLMRFSTNGYYPIQQLRTGVTYTGLIGQFGDETRLADGKVRIPVSSAVSTLWPATGSSFSLGDTTVSNAGGLFVWADNQSRMLNLHRTGSPSTWVFGDDLNSFTINRLGTTAQFALHRNAPANAFVIDAEGDISIGGASTAGRFQIFGARNGSGIIMSGLNTANDKGITFQNTAVTGQVQMFASDLSASGNVFGQIRNLNTTDGTANAVLFLNTSGANAGDPYITMGNNIVNMAFGIDNSNSDMIRLQPSASVNTIAQGFWMKSDATGHSSINRANPTLAWEIASLQDQTQGVTSLSNTTVTTPIKLFATNNSPEGLATANPGDFACANTGKWFGKFTGTGNTGWGQFLNRLDGMGATLNQTLRWDGDSWEPTTVSVSGDGMGDHTASQPLNMNGFNLINGNLATFDTITVTSSPYATGWNGDNTVPTKDAVFDKIESISTANKVTKGGDADGTPLRIGTNDAQSLELETNGVMRMRINASGTVDFQQSQIDNIDALTADSTATLAFRMEYAPNIKSRTLTTSGVLFRDGITYINSASAVTMTTNTALPDLSMFKVRNINTGTVTIAPASGLTLNGSNIILPGETGEFHRNGTVIYRLDNGGKEYEEIITATTGTDGVFVLNHPFGSSAIKFAAATPQSETEFLHVQIKTLSSGVVSFQIRDAAGAEKQVTNVPMRCIVKI